MQQVKIAKKIAAEKETICEYIDQLQGILAETKSLVTSSQAEEEVGMLYTVLQYYYVGGC